MKLFLFDPKITNGPILIVPTTVTRTNGHALLSCRVIGYMHPRYPHGTVVENVSSLNIVKSKNAEHFQRASLAEIQAQVVAG